MSGSKKHPPSTPMKREMEARGVVAAINEWELMGTHYAGYDDMMSAPAWHVMRMRLVQQGKAAADKVLSEDMDEGSSGSTSGSGVAAGSRGETRVSAYYPHEQRG